MAYCAKRKNHVPSVTTVLAPFSGIEDVKRRFPGVIERAAARGTAVHGYCENAARGLFVMGIPAEHQGYFDSFMRWLSDVAEVVATELRLLDPKLGFHGQLDVLCRLRGDADLSLWDYKTPEYVSPTWGPQIAAYAHLARLAGYPVRRAGLIRLRKTGRAPIVTEYTDSLRRHWNVYVSAINVYNAFFAKGRKS
jgi:hypothetical protein